MDFIAKFLLALTSLINVFLALFIWSKNYKKSVNIIFGFLAFSVALWSFANLMSISVDTIDSGIFWTQMCYLGSLLISYFFVLFSYIFPRNNLNKKVVWFFSVLLFLGIIIIFWPGFLVKNVTLDSWKSDVVSNSGIYYFTIIFSVFIFVAIYNLYLNYKKAIGISKIQLKFILLGSFISIFLGGIFNLLFPLFGNFKFSWVGPNFSLAMV